MPRSTFAYWFEMKVQGVGAALADRHRDQAPSDDPTQPWLFVLGDDGEPRYVPLGDTWRETKEQMVGQGRPFLLFHPFDAPEYTWVEWHGIDRDQMERLMGEPFAAEDFRHLSGEDAEPIPFPDTWSVMF